jgi:uncharacterized protein
MSKSFVPFPFIDSGLMQTIASAYWPCRPDRLPRTTHDVRLDDEDQLRIIENRPSQWQAGGRIVLAIHGLGGHAGSNYMIRLARRLTSRGYLVLRVNLRGCGEGFGLAKNPYHSGRSEDLRVVLKWAAQHHPGSPVTLVGYSLGANITLKLAGEDGDRPTGNLDSLVAVSPPVHLAKTALHLKRSSNLVFDQFFVWKLRYDLWKLHRRYPELPKPRIPFRIHLTGIDEFYTAPRSGFKDAQDYYARASSAPLVPKIAVRGLILCAEDDPIVDASTVAALELPPQMELLMTRRGGHVGFLGGSLKDPQWMDQVVENFISQLAQV